MGKIDFNELKNSAMKKATEIAKEGKDIAEKGMQKAKEGAAIAVDQMQEAKYNHDLKVIDPVDLERMQSFGYQIPTLIQIFENDKRMDNPVCATAIGFNEKVKGDMMLCIKNKLAKETGLTFTPSLTNTFYCKNPYVDNMYICLDDYFSYIEAEKVNELEKIAQSLGAKKVRITFKEMKKTIVSKKVDVKESAKLPKGVSVDITGKHETDDSQFDGLKILSDLTFEGNNAPTEPELVYFKGNNDVASLIDMRMHSKNPIKSKTYRFYCGRGKELQQSDAATIDVFLKKKGLEGNGTMVSEVQSEQRKVLEYTIEF